MYLQHPNKRSCLGRLFLLLLGAWVIVASTACAPLGTGVDGLGPDGGDGSRVAGNGRAAKTEQEAPQLQDLAKFGLLKEEPKDLLPESEEPFYDFPMAKNDRVDYYLDFFANRHRKTFARWLARSGRYLPMIKKKFAEAGIPLDLAYLPMIESGFNPSALSRSSAVGTWQFMRKTGLNYGLTVNDYVDERLDPIKSTQAAAAYLSALHDRFDSWHLAVAAYNAGEGTVTKAMKQEDSNDFWEIAQGRYLQDETKLYVPQLIAAIMIAKEPEKYGFDSIDYETPVEFETVHVPSGTHLKAVALACDVGVGDLQDLNRQLCKSVTPPSQHVYPLRVPIGKKNLVTLNLPRVREVVTTDYKDHVVIKGETVGSICRKYGLSKTTLLKANSLRRERLSPGHRLRIPVKSSRFVMVDEEELAHHPTSRHHHLVKAEPAENGVLIMANSSKRPVVEESRKGKEASRRVIAASGGKRGVSEKPKRAPRAQEERSPSRKSRSSKKKKK